ncbi:unnamed protein product [Cyclocybe aegerita]|uniref:Uncharacterized protein n=1 Tax=Cyclocybe aegerita TaxID=1973307 RepID=A0A8S0XJU7_CYCAE|nr:unnamed protein product [Cyclocybe aegerita]
MAQPTPEIAVLPDSTGKEVKEKVAESEGGAVEGAGSKSVEGSSSTPFVAGADPHAEKTPSTDSQPSGPPSRPSLVPLGSGHAQTASSTPVAPHPKRFSAVNINKKFLEKNTASGSATTSSSSSITKSGSPATRPATQPNTSHSRLVTAKLTASPAVSSTAGWSRPSSVAPSPATVTNSPSSTSPLPTPSTLSSNTAAPQLPHAGKVIQPQPRTATAPLGSLQKESSSKPVWGNVKPPSAVPIRPDIEPSDFPTAAEVANVPARKQPKAEDSKGVLDSTKQLRSEEADTFRGVHLDPNAHHWDEMEEDNDNFLADVIEFGDGRQYKVESSDAQQIDSNSAPVAKEDRFVDDFDRSWPRSRDSPGSGSRDFPPASAHSASPNVSPVNLIARVKDPLAQDVRAIRKAMDLLENPKEAQEMVLTTFNSSSGGLGPSGSTGFTGGHRDRELPNRRDGPPLSPRFSRDQDREFNDRGRKSTMGPPPLPLHARHPQDGGRQLPPHLSQASPKAPQRRLSSRDSGYQPSEPPLSASLPPSASSKIPPQSPATSHKSLISPASAVSVLPLTAPELDEARKDVMHTAAARAKQRRLEEEQERESQKERARRKAAELEAKMKAEEAKAKAVKEKDAIAVIEEAVKNVENGEAAPEEAQLTSTKHSLKRPPSLRAIPPVSPSDTLRSVGPRRMGTIPPRTGLPLTPVATPATQSESWRARAGPLPPPPASQPPKQIQPRLSTSTNFVASGPSAAEQVETIADGSKDDLEVVDFSDLGKFIGVPESSQSPKEPATEARSGPTILPRTSRPVASDFFDEPTAADVSTVASKKADFGAWRKRVSQDVNEPLPAPPSTQDAKVDVVSEAQVESATQTSTFTQSQPLPEDSVAPEASMASTKVPLSHVDNSHGGQTVHVPPHFSNSPRTPRSQTFYRESALSALDDAMSRIKGVLHDMHVPKEPSLSETEVQPPRVQLGQTSSRPVVKERWVPPALRARKYDDGDEPREEFLVTIVEPPLSPPGTSIVVRLPSVSRPVGFIHQRQLHPFWRAPYQPRMDILSFDPPVYDMRRDLSMNNVLFRKPPPGAKGKYKYRVYLPRSRGPRVHMPQTGPAGKPNGSGAFGRPTVADGASSWRKPAVSPATQRPSVPEEPSGLDIMSRSPPPDIKPSDVVVASIPKSSESSPTKSESSQGARSRLQPKMPEGSSVAFLRDSRVDVVVTDAKPLVNFIIGSQLEDSTRSTAPKTPEGRQVPLPSAASEVKPESRKPVSNGLIKSSSEDEGPNLSSSSKVDSVDPVLITPPSHRAHDSWARSSVSLAVKESPSRAPDPELLKAVWSQPPNKASIQPVNSLEGIADDLAFPLLLQDVKPEEGGETPPPSLPSVPSRMSLHDVTRAFQQVPTSSSSTNQLPHRDRAAISPPSTNAPVARPTPAAYTYSPAPGPQNNMRPAYPSYPSPMMSHSPAPVMYGHPSPVPSQMHAQVNGHAPMYGQPVWMPMPAPAPQPQHANMMRPVPSPYPAQMMTYASPGYAPQHPPPNMMPRTPQGPNAGRGRGMLVMSPVVSHAHAHPGTMYTGSPVMMHAVPVPQNHAYMPMPAGRGQPPRPENGQLLQHPPPPGNHPPSHGGFNPAPPSQFVRSAW